MYILFESMLRISKYREISLFSCKGSFRTVSIKCSELRILQASSELSPGEVLSNTIAKLCDFPRAVYPLSIQSFEFMVACSFVKIGSGHLNFFPNSLKPLVQFVPSNIHMHAAGRSFLIFGLHTLTILCDIDSNVCKKIKIFCGTIHKKHLIHGIICF